MRRYQRSYLSSFGYGILIAAGTAGSLVGAHHLLAPPGSDVETADVSTHMKTEPGAPAAGGVERWSNPLSPAVTPVPAPGPASGRSSPIITATLPAEAAPRVGEAQRSLTQSIQRELRRVGCYAGEADGTWSPATRAAMAAFNDSVKTELPVSGPDYILLTLLQGHSARACGRGDPSITVKAPVPKVATRPSVAAIPDVPSRERSVMVEQPRPALPPPRAVVATPQPPPTVATALPVAQPVPSPSTLPLPPGRMAVGGPASIPTVGQLPEGPALLPLAVVGPDPGPRAVAPGQRPRPTEVTRPTPRDTGAQQRRQASNGGGPSYKGGVSPLTSGVFSNVNRNSP